MRLLTPLLRQAIKAHRLPILATLVFWNLALLLEAAGIVFFQKIIDRLGSADSFEPLLTLIAIYACVWAGNHILMYVDNYPDQLLEKGLEQWTRVVALEKVSRLDYLAYQNLGTGRLVQVIENGAEAVQKIVFDFWVRIFRELVPTALFSLIFIGAYDERIFVVLLAGYILVFAISYWLLGWLRRRKEQILIHQEAFSRSTVRGFMELVVFRTNRRFQREIEEVSGLSTGIVKGTAEIKVIHELFFTLFALIVLALQVGVIVYEANRIIAGTSTVGTLVALVAFVQKVYQPVAIFNTTYVYYRLNQLAYARFESFMSLPEDSNIDKSAQLELQGGEIAFEAVGFSYGDRPILRDFSLTIEGRKSLAVVGDTGAGKSTLAKLSVGLLKPRAGRITIDGQDVAGLSLDSLYSHVVYMSQDAPVFDGTLRENLVFDVAVPDRTLVEALRKVRLDELLVSLPHGLDTELGERGIKLSGGEKQRLGFARLFLMQPEIIVLDEPTSALDSVTEEFVTEHLTELFGDKTLVVIAHRLQTVRNLDRIIVMRDGEVVEDGDFAGLLARHGLFRELWESQTRSPVA